MGQIPRSMERISSYCSETDYSFCEDSLPPQQDSALYPDAGFTLTPFSPHYFFRSAALDVIIIHGPGNL